MCQIFFLPRTFIKIFCQWNSTTFPHSLLHTKQSSIGESRISASQKVQKWELIPQFFVLKLCGDHKGIKYWDNLNLICNLFHLNFSYHQLWCSQYSRREHKKYEKNKCVMWERGLLRIGQSQGWIICYLIGNSLSKLKLISSHLLKAASCWITYFWF